MITTGSYFFIACECLPVVAKIDRDGGTMKQDRKPFGLRMPASMKAWVKAGADAEGRSANNLILRIIADEMRVNPAPIAQEDRA